MHALPNLENAPVVNLFSQNVRLGGVFVTDCWQTTTEISKGNCYKNACQKYLTSAT